MSLLLCNIIKNHKEQEKSHYDYSPALFLLQKYYIYITITKQPKEKSMFKRSNKLTITEQKLYEKEIKRLSKESAEWMAKYEIANKYKNEYEKLATEYTEKVKELDKLIKRNKDLAEEQKQFLHKLKNK